jgi:predicted dehydrogenase
MSEEVTRRGFVKTSAAVAAAGVVSSLASSKAYGANERIRVGYIGTANRGGQLIEATVPHKDAEIVAVCDVFKPAMEQWPEKLGHPVDMHQDFRELLDRKDIDAVVIATPDHWHALQTIMACQAGKDVYVEKPLSITIHEGRKMVEAARKYEKVVAVGTHRRASKMIATLHDTIRNDTIGKVTLARYCRLSNMWPKGIGKAEDQDPPADLDWDMWLGPRPFRPFRPTIAPYRFRWWHLYSSQLGNWGVHYFDLFRWVLDEVAPVSVVALGGQYAVDDDRTIPDTLEVVFEFASGRLINFGQYEASGYQAIAKGQFEIRGTKGIVLGTDRLMDILPERGGQFQKSEPRMEPMQITHKEEGSNHGMTAANIRNWLDCIKTRERPLADVEEGHRSTTMSHLGNIALATKSRIDWDPETERITNNEAANELLHYEYREPWKLTV